MITEIVKEANLTGAKEEKLPYPMGNLPLSKTDCATDCDYSRQILQKIRH